MTDTASEGATFATIHPPESIHTTLSGGFFVPKS